MTLPLATTHRPISTTGLIIPAGGYIYANALVVATVTVPNVGSGGTDAALTLQLYQLDGVTPITEARQVIIAGSTARYVMATPSSTLSFATATTGTIKYAGSGYALIETSAAGAFACTAANSADETLYFKAISPPSVAAADVLKAAVVVGCNEDSAAWSA